MGINPAEIIAQLIGFLVLLWLFSAYGWKPLRALLDSRREKIAADLAKIEADEARIRETLSAYEAKIKDLEKTSRDAIGAAAAEGAQTAAGIVRNAREEAEKLIARAKADAERDVAAARLRLRREIGELVLTATERLLGEKMTPEKDRRLVENFLRDLDRPADAPAPAQRP
jgi:F-type H+-transporting ATPase subunit b